MLILTIRTDKPEAEIGIFDDSAQLDYYSWQAHRALSETIHQVVRDRLNAVDKNLQDIKGIVYFSGPGSFTGLRIGAAVVNAFKEGLGAAVVSAAGDTWRDDGIVELLNGTNSLALPVYGSDAHITQPRK